MAAYFLTVSPPLSDVASFSVPSALAYPMKIEIAPKK
jgi:hypothetical protein